MADQHQLDNILARYSNIRKLMRITPPDKDPQLYERAEQMLKDWHAKGYLFLFDQDASTWKMQPLSDPDPFLPVQVETYLIQADWDTYKRAGRMYYRLSDQDSSLDGYMSQQCAIEEARRRVREKQLIQEYQQMKEQHVRIWIRDLIQAGRTDSLILRLSQEFLRGHYPSQEIEQILKQCSRYIQEERQACKSGKSH